MSVVAGVWALIHTLRQWTGDWLMTLCRSRSHGGCCTRAWRTDGQDGALVRGVAPGASAALYVKAKLDKLVGPEKAETGGRLRPFVRMSRQQVMVSDGSGRC